MFGGYHDVLPYVPQEAAPEEALPVILVNDVENDFICAEILPITSAFGGFKTWTCTKSDFILIAECSELSGPNPMCTIPAKQNLVSDLNALCVRILSADYQEFGSNKDVPSEGTQLLIPDVMIDIHIAVNHFTLYDAEARGFVRPLCIAYVTADKHKLLQLAKPVFKWLSDASGFIRHCNRRFCISGLQKLMLDLELTKSTLSSCDALQNKCSNPEERLKVYNNLIESCMEDIRRILDSAYNAEGMNDVDTIIRKFMSRLKQKLEPTKLVNNQNDDSEAYVPKQLKIPIQQNFDKHLKNLYFLSPDGILLALYHLNLMHKYFRRKYENIALHVRDKELTGRNDGNCLYFGACLKINKGVNNASSHWQCSINMHSLTSLCDFSDDQYFCDMDDEFCDFVLNFLKRQNALKNEFDACGEEMESSNFGGNEDTSLEEKHVPVSSDPSSLSRGEYFAELKKDCSRHIVTLGGIWDIIDHIESEITEVESLVLEIFRLVNQTESILYSLLARNLVVILYSAGEELLARVLIQVLAVLVPRKMNESVFVEHNRTAPLELSDLKNLAVVSYCMPCQVSNMIPHNIMSSVAVLNLAEGKYSGLKYIGCLLQDLNENVRNLSLKDPVLPFLVSIFAEIELQVKFWKEIVLSSATSAISTVYLIHRGFTRCDIKIIEELSKLYTNDA